MHPNQRRVGLVTLSTLTLFALGVLSACSNTPNLPPSAHLRDSDVKASATGAIPSPVQSSINVPRPKPASKTETYSVVVNNVKAQELLFALARDAKLNIDIHPGIVGNVTLNAIDQTLQQLLQRISKQVDMRWELDGPNLSVMPDTPFLRTYKIDYVNLSRDSSGTISASSQISTGVPGASTSASTGGSGNNVSTSKVENKISNHFWESLERNIKDLLRETDKLLPEGSSETIIERSDQQNTTGTGAQNRTATRNPATTLATSPNAAAMQQEETTAIRRTTYREAASVIVNAESGIINVRATARQHEKVQEFVDKVMESARRQVMIEATIVEVTLSDTYKQGIEWARFRADGSGFSVSSPSPTTGAFTLKNIKKTPLDLLLTMNLLQQFGDVKVLSSPRLSVLNNQSAILKVVENYVYFSVKSDIATSTVVGAAPIKAFTTTPQSVSIGLVMVVTPQISENNSITLNVRPSITSISDFAKDPNPDLTIENKVPMIRTREMESIMRVEDGEIAVLGGLMQEKSDYNTGRLPIAGAIPFFGEAFTRRENAVTKSELVIFLRPVVVRDPSLAGDFKHLRNFLPKDDFMQRPDHAAPFGINGKATP